MKAKGQIGHGNLDQRQYRLKVTVVAGALFDQNGLPMHGKLHFTGNREE